MEGKTVLFIRCGKKTRKKFREFVVHFDFPNYEAALQRLLKLAEDHPELVKVVWG